ncbi:MAG: Dps family protein [Bacteroidales bacterium]
MKTLNYTHLLEAKAEKIINALQQLLADYQIYYTNLRGYHWNIQGPDFFVLHSKFEELYNDTAEKADQLAERILMLGGVPVNNYSQYLQSSQIKEVSNVHSGDEALKQILNNYSHFISEERALISLASEAGDEVTIAMLSDYLQEQEKMIWMLTASMSK